MIQKTALVIMAAGLGSRYGGVKQLEPVGPSGEIIMDYSIYNAIEAGFNKIVFIIRKEMQQDFKKVRGNRFNEQIEIEYVFQELDDLPEGYRKPKDRTKPWGTGQAIISCREVIKEPFIVVNADDYYGKESFQTLRQFLIEQTKIEEKSRFCMAGFQLGNTLSANGAVTRGICKVDSNNYLVRIEETKNIIKGRKAAVIIKEDKTTTELPLETPVSMNMWGFTPSFIELLQTKFREFLDIEGSKLTSEFLLPTIIDTMLKRQEIEVTVLNTKDCWFGVTYKEDKQFVVDSFQKLVEKGIYPKKLF